VPPLVQVHRDHDELEREKDPVICGANKTMGRSIPFAVDKDVGSVWKYQEPKQRCSTYPS
jgi:hypothetical protein